MDRSSKASFVRNAFVIEFLLEDYKNKSLSFESQLKFYMTLMRQIPS